MPKSNVVLFIRPLFDRHTYYGAYFLEDAIQYARLKGFDVVDVTGSEITEADILAAIQEYDPYYLVVCGHGCANVVVSGLLSTSDVFYTPPGCVGHLHESSNVGVLKDRAVFFLACNVADNLVQQVNAAGARLVAGFSDTFGWIADPESGYDPSTDPYAPSFFLPIIGLVNGILDGAGPDVLYGKYEADLSASIYRWNLSGDYKASMVTSWLESNRDSFHLYVDGSEYGVLDVGGALLLAAVGAGLYYLWRDR